MLAIIALPLLGLPQAVYGQTEPGPTPLFAEATPLALTIEGPFRTLSRERRERNELEGLVRYQGGDGTEVTLDVQIRTRGNSRMDICTYPPLRLNFRRRQVEGTVFAGQDRIKLVTLCKDTGSYRNYLALEYEIYRIYNALSDISYRVRWADIEYVRTDGRRRTSESMPGFLIEEDTEVAARTGLETWEVERLDLGCDRAQRDGARESVPFLHRQHGLVGLRPGTLAIAAATTAMSCARLPVRPC